MAAKKRPIRNLNKISGVLCEYRKIYRELRYKELSNDDGKALIYALKTMASIMEVGDLEKRVETLESQNSVKKSGLT